MDYTQLIERLHNAARHDSLFGDDVREHASEQAATALEALQARCVTLESEKAAWVRRADKTWNEKHFTDQIEALQARVTELEHLDGQRLASLREIEAERNAALSKLAESEKQEPVATIGSKAFNVYHQSNGHSWLEPAGSKTVLYFKELPVGTKLYASPVPAPKTLSSESLRDLIASHMTCTYVCTRVWEAWSVGTMGQDDFLEVTETELVEDLATAIEAALKGGAL